MKAAFLVIGFVVLGVAWVGPLAHLAKNSFFAHMTVHIGVVAVAAPLLSLGIAGTRFDPVSKAGALFSPIPASMLELFVVWAWHAPALHHAARHSSVWFIAEQGLFLGCGILVWLSAFGGESPRKANRTAAGIFALLITSMHMTLLGALIGLAPRPLFLHAGGAHGLSPLQDQHLGGAIMLVGGGVSYLAGGLWLTFDLLRETHQRRELRA